MELENKIQQNYGFSWLYPIINIEEFENKKKFFYLETEIEMNLNTYKNFGFEEFKKN